MTGPDILFLVPIAGLLYVIVMLYRGWAIGHCDFCKRPMIKHSDHRKYYGAWFLIQCSDCFDRIYDRDEEQYYKQRLEALERKRKT